MQQIMERGGGLEIALDRGTVGKDPVEEAGAADLVWRVRIMAIEEECIVIEAPVALGRVIALKNGARLVAAMTVGQNRWKFKTRKVSESEVDRTRLMRIEAPESVERCLRCFTRFDVAGLSLPLVRCFPLLDPASVVEPERVVATIVDAFLKTGAVAKVVLPLPKVGPEFPAVLMNVGGGGVGLRVEPAEASALNRHRILWIEIDLGRDMPVPLAVTGKVVHTRIDSSQHTYAGISFDFSFNMTHHRTVIEQVRLYVERVQQRVMQTATSRTEEEQL
ncbi:MAG: flagellar brake domain-containing protein [Planctomycetota bacterium]|nr:flagellar brake domain-containing protein [Planctomycetota bacterium]